MATKVTDSLSDSFTEQLPTPDYANIISIEKHIMRAGIIVCGLWSRVGVQFTQLGNVSTRVSQ